MFRDTYRPAEAVIHGERALSWTVKRCFEGIDSISYVVLVKADDPTVHKTLAASVLSDRRRYLAS